jgi:hypothetical protein
MQTQGEEEQSRRFETQDRDWAITHAQYQEARRQYENSENRRESTWDTLMTEKQFSVTDDDGNTQVYTQQQYEAAWDEGNVTSADTVEEFERKMDLKALLTSVDEAGDPIETDRNLASAIFSMASGFSGNFMGGAPERGDGGGGGGFWSNLASGVVSAATTVGTAWAVKKATG